MKRFVRIYFEMQLLLLLAVIILALLLLGGFVLFSAWRAWNGAAVADPTSTAILGQQGDFFGGHFATVLSAFTLALLILTTYTQTRAARRESARALFSSGVDAISTYDTASPGCPQAMRLLNYYSRLALQHDDEEFYLLLNTVITGPIRQQLRQSGCPYFDARELRVQITRVNALAGLRRRLGYIRGTYRFLTGRYRRIR